MARTGKIARLPYVVRTQLNEKIRDGLPGTEIVAWLNEHTSVKRVLKEYFEGRPINEQNLTEWKAGGYPEWLQMAETHAQIKDRIAAAHDLEECAGELSSVADSLATILAVELDRCLQETVQDPSLSAAERREAILSIAHASAHLRRTNHAHRRLTILQEERLAQQEAADLAELTERHKQADWLRSVREAMERLQKDAEEKRLRRKPPTPKPKDTPASQEPPPAPPEPQQTPPVPEPPPTSEIPERLAPQGLY